MSQALTLAAHLPIRRKDYERADRGALDRDPCTFALLVIYTGHMPLSVAYISPYLDAARTGGVLVPIAAVFLAILLGGWRQMQSVTVWSKLIYSVAAVLIVVQLVLITVIINR